MPSPKSPPSARLLRHWGIGGPVTFDRLTAGTMNHSWRVDSSHGAYVLKGHLDADRPQIMLQHRVTAGLRDAGLPVPVAVPASRRRTVVTAGRVPYALYPWVDGRHRHGLDLSYPECRALGELLGGLHDRLGVIMPAVQQTLVVPTAVPEDALTLIDGLLAGIPWPRGDFDRLAERRLKERRAMIRRYAGLRPPDVEAVTVGYVHGDFHALNLLYGEDDTVNAVLDWDRLAVAPFGRELVRAATLFFGHGDERGLDLRRVAEFTRGYRDRFDLDGTQIASAVHRLWWERLCDQWMLQWHYGRGDHSCDHLFPPAAALIEWWSEHRRAVLDAFLARDAFLERPQALAGRRQGHRPELAVGLQR